MLTFQLELLSGQFRAFEKKLLEELWHQSWTVQRQCLLAGWAVLALPSLVSVW